MVVQQRKPNSVTNVSNKRERGESSDGGNDTPKTAKKMKTSQEAKNLATLAQSMVGGSSSPTKSTVATAQPQMTDAQQQQAFLQYAQWVCSVRARCVRARSARITIFSHFHSINHSKINPRI